MSDLVEFLRKRLDEDEQVALACEHKAWEWCGTEVITLAHPVARPIADGKYRLSGSDPLAETDAEHIARHDPARVLREVEAKRRIIQWCVDCIGDFDLQRYGEFGSLQTHDQPLAVTLGIETLLRLALPHDQHPDYREEWRP